MKNMCDTSGGIITLCIRNYILVYFCFDYQTMFVSFVMEYTLGNDNLESTKSMTTEQIFQSLNQLQMTAVAHCFEKVQTETHTTLLQISSRNI